MAEHYTVPGMDAQTAQRIVELLQQRLATLIDLQLTLKHVHWNVVGPQFISVHEMLDPQVGAAREMTDEVAERIATLGGEPVGTIGQAAKHRGREDYGLARASAVEHLVGVDRLYVDVIAGHRECIAELDALDLVTQELLISQAQKLELYQWFVRAHLEDSQGRITQDER